MQQSNRVALVQMRSSGDKVKNLKLSVEYVKEASRKKACLICFPEFQMMFSPKSQSLKQLGRLAESVTEGNFISSLCKAAKRNKINIVATIYEKNDTSVYSHVYDTAIIINDRGFVSSTYRKVHLYDALGFKESNKFAAGNTIEEPTKTPIGKVGLLICYDIRFPEMARILSVKGADILISPSAWVEGVMKEEHWETMLKARAIENGSYVIAPDQVGNMYSGRSMVVDPFGTVVLDMGNREGMEIIEIDRLRIKKVRESLPLLLNRRIDVYRDSISVFG
jgi:predicted amidohydrolase